jgi:RimJ/RimL family protein N-acetyltransferase
LVELRPFVESDLATMAVALADPEVRRLTGSVTSDVEANAGVAVPDDAMRAWYGARGDTDDRLDLAIVDLATGRTVGESVLNEWDPTTWTCNFRILIGRDGRDRGLGSEATKLTLDYAFDVLGLRRVSLCVFSFNPRAQHVYEQVGFRVNDIERGGLLYDGEPIDDIAMAIDADQYRARRAGRSAG